MLKFRTLKADEIECRAALVKESQKGVGAQLLLYKDARCDQNILDETVGPMDWQRHHTRENANCVVSIWCEEKKQWIEKEDVGTESYSQAEKGLASDSFKRACFNWGIGRELYTAPFIWVTDKNVNFRKNNKGVWMISDTLSVSEIEYDELKRIIYLSIKNESNGKICYVFGRKPSGPVSGSEFCCADCGKPFAEFSDKNGKVWTPEMQYKAAASVSPDGVARCAACRKKIGGK